MSQNPILMNLKNSVVALLALITANAIMLLEQFYGFNARQDMVIVSGLMTLIAILATKNYIHPFRLIPRRTFSQNFDRYIVSGVISLLLIDAMLNVELAAGMPSRVIVVGLIYVGFKHLQWLKYPPHKEELV